ncbi:hypothetical protein QTP88_012135 [Uroleucon formosanum]
MVTGWLPEAIENKCEDCSEKQKMGSEKIIKFLFEKKNDMWKQLEEKYDPKGLYRQRYSEDAKKLNIDRCVLIGSRVELAPSDTSKEVEWFTDVHFLDSKP